MSNIQTDSRRQRPTAVILAPAIPHIEPDHPGGWFVIRGSYGWLYGSRHEALDAHRELTQEVRP